MSNGIVTPTVEEFLEMVFGPDDWQHAWVCAFPEWDESWRGRRYAAGYIRDDTNNYFAIGLLDPARRADADTDRRASDAVISHHLFFADDVGTKVDPEKWEAMIAMGFPRPTFKIETSEGNGTWVWLLDRPIIAGDEVRVRALRVVREAMNRLGLSDPLPDDARYIRLPCGINGKPKYAGPNGEHPTVKLVEWNRGQTANIEACAAILAGSDWQDKDDAALGIKGGSSYAGALHRTADMNNPDPVIQLAIELGMNPVQVRPGVVEAACPNIASHTTREDTGFAFLGNGLMECSHASCQHLRTPDFLRMMCESYDSRQETRAALGLPLEGPETADEFLARATFEYHDRKAGRNGTGELVEEAGKIAVQTAAATAAHQAWLAQSEDDLVERYRYVTQAGVVFDTVTRRSFTPQQYDQLKEVTRVIPAGSTGAKRAFNRLLNHPKREDVDTFCYVPGDHRAIVHQENEFGRLVPCANTWVGPDIKPVPLRPDTWLQHMSFIYDTPDALEFILDWLAWVLQNGDKRPSLVPLLVGEQGVGKDMAWGPIIRILGRHNVYDRLTSEKLASDFTEYLESRLIIMPELRMTDRKSYDAFKDLTSVDERRVTINRKHMQPYSVRAIHIVIAMSNNMDAIACLDAKDRRVWVHETRAKRLDIVGDIHTPGSQAYFQHVRDTLATDDEIGRIYWFLMNRDVSGFNPHAAAPDFVGAKQAMLVDTLNMASRFAYEAVQPSGLLAGRTIITTKEVMDLAIAQGGEQVRRYLTGRAIVTGLEAAGCEYAGRLGTANVKQGYDHRIRLWFLPNTPAQRRADVKAATGSGPKDLYEQEVKAWNDARLAGLFSSAA